MENNAVGPASNQQVRRNKCSGCFTGREPQKSTWWTAGRIARTFVSVLNSYHHCCRLCSYYVYEKSAMVVVVDLLVSLSASFFYILDSIRCDDSMILDSMMIHSFILLVKESSVSHSGRQSRAHTRDPYTDRQTDRQTDSQGTAGNREQGTASSSVCRSTFGIVRLPLPRSNNKRIRNISHENTRVVDNLPRASLFSRRPPCSVVSSSPPFFFLFSFLAFLPLRVLCCITKSNSLIVYVQY
jgi:hypothetical protein